MTDLDEYFDIPDEPEDSKKGDAYGSDMADNFKEYDKYMDRDY